MEAPHGDTRPLPTGADTVETLEVYLGMLRAGSHVTGPPEAVVHLRTLAARYAAATS